MTKSSSLCLISSCLLGLCTRYDGDIKPVHHQITNTRDMVWIPVCPEQLGGLPTPREAARIIDGDGYDVIAGRSKVITVTGQDVTENFLRGAHETLKIAQFLKISRAILKSRSPSCAVSSPAGVTAALLKESGLSVTEL